MKIRLNQLVVLMLALLGITTGVRARQDSGFSEGGEVGLKVVAVGVGNRARPGDWAGIQVEVLHRSSNPKPMAVIVRWDVPNDDGDLCQNQRTVTTNPNRPVSVWLYGRLPFDFDSNSTITVRAFLPFDQEAGSDEFAAYDPSKHIGMVTHTARAVISKNSGLIGVVGRRSAGVDRYAERIVVGSSDVPLTGHELTEVAEAITPAMIPDRVHGLRSLEAIVWTGSSAEEQPGKLQANQADAIREWVAGGGHLVVVIPLVGQTWIDTPNPLSDLMPAVHLQRHEGVSLEPIRALLTPHQRATLPEKSILHTFTPDPAAGPFDAIPIFKETNDRIIVVRRLYGIGAVTLVGLDVTNITVRADAFWNRVLGKRLWLPSRKEVDDALNASQLFTFNRTDHWLERSIPGYLNWASEAAVGLLVAVVVFGAFWLIAGPVGFFVLKQRNKTQHAWVAYAGAILAFTAISWSFASVLRQRSPEGKHVTILDHVYGQPCQRARVWANVFLPTYGTARVSVPKKAFEIGGRPLQPNPAITAWEYSQVGAGSAEFPETRSYPVNTASPDSVEFPARSTTRQIQVDWVGSPRWSMPLPQSTDTSGTPSLGDELKLLHERVQGMDGRWTVTGTLTHDLPAALSSVLIIVNRGQHDVRPLQNGTLWADAAIFSLANPWEPGTPLDLREATTPRPGDINAVRADAYLDSKLTPRSANTYGGFPTATSEKEDIAKAKSEIVTNLLRLSLYGMLQPPRPDQQNDNRCAVRRQSAHTMDVSRWFTQPCVIIIGFIEGADGKPGSECPVPIEVNGRDFPYSNGLTCVRWVYPLKGAPPEYVELTQRDSGGAPGDN